MISQKKGLKLSRQNTHSKQVKVSGKELDDSLDDFVMTQSLKAARRGISNPQPLATTQKLSVIAEWAKADGIDSEGVSIGKSNSPSKGGRGNEIFGTGTSTKRDEIFSPSSSKTSVIEGSSVKKCESPVSVFLCPLCGRKFAASDKKDKHVGKCAQSKNVDPKTLQRVEELLDRQIAERLSLGLDAVPGKKTADRRPRNKKVDPSDISLALALSESLQTANEVARRNEEELLLQENLSEVVFDLRQEEYAAGGMANVVHKPAEATTKIKKKSSRSNKNPPKEYVLSVRTPAERERMIADRAAAVLSQIEDESPPIGKPLKYANPMSEYLNRFHLKSRPLWELTGMPDEKLSPDFSDESNDPYFVPALRDALSPDKKNKGYSNILLHVSQLPGRNSSQLNTLSNTQDILEELAFKADGGFFDDGLNVEEPSLAKKSCTTGSTATLSNDWFQFVNNPTLSDIKILTRQKPIRAHRLVLSVRCPGLLKKLVEVDQRNFILDLSSHSEVAAEAVLCFVYSGQYQPRSNSDAIDVYRIAQRLRLEEFIAVLEENHDHLRNILIEEEPVEEEFDSTQNMSLSEELPAPQEPAFPKQSTVPDKKEVVENFQIAEHSREVFDDCSIIDKSTFSPKHKEPLGVDIIASSSTEESGNESDDGIVEVVPPPSQIQINESVPMELVSEIERPRTPDLFEDTLEPMSMKLCTPEKEERDCDVVDLTQESPEAEKSLRSSLTSSPLQPLSLLQLLQPSSPLQMAQSPVYAASKTIHAFEKSTASDVDLWNYDDPALHCEEQVEPAPGVMKTPAVRAIEREPRSRSPKNVPEVNDSLQWPDLDPLDTEYLLGASPSTSSLPRLTLAGAAAGGSADSYHTPDPPRLAKKRKIEVTPQPDYDSMDTPNLQKELDKYGLKPLKRKNAVKLLEHIYEELHPLVTDSESSFQDTPERPTNGASNKAVDASSQSSDDASDLAEESIVIPNDWDDDINDPPLWSSSQQQQQSQCVPLKDRMKDFLKTRPDIHKLLLTYEPIQFEWLLKEMRQKGISCKTQQLLDWLDEECITFRMNNKRNGGSSASPSKKSPGKSPGKARRTCSKKLVG